MKTVTLNVEIKTEEGVKSIGDLNSEIKTTINTIGELENTVELLREELKGLEVGSEEFEKIQKELLKADSALKDANKSIEGLDFEAKAGELGKLTGGIGSVGTAIALTFGENESVEEFFQTFATGIAITEGVKGAIEAFAGAQKLLNGITVAGTILRTKEIAQTVALTTVKAAQTVATVAATAAQWALNAAMTANPIGLIVVGIAALITGIVLLVKNIDSVIDWFVNLGETIMWLLNPIQMLIDAYNYFFGEVEESEESLAEKRKENWEEFDKQHKEQQAKRKEEIKTIRETIDEIQHKKDIQKEQNDLRLLQAEAEGASERELFELQKSINEQTLELTRQEIEADNLLIEKQHEIAQAEYDRFLQFLDTQAIYNGMSQKEIDDLRIRLEEKKKQYLKDEAERIESNARTIATLEAQNQIYINNYLDSIKDANDKEVKNIVEKLDNLKNEYNSFSDFMKDKSEDIIFFDDDSIEEEFDFVEEKIDVFSGKIDEFVFKLRAFGETGSKALAEEIQQTFSELEENLSTIFSFIDQGLNTFNDIADRIAENRADKNERLYERETQALSNQLSNREINQKEYDAKLEILEQKRINRERIEKRKAFNREKANNIAQATMQTSLAVLQALGSTPPPASYILAGVSAALGAVQIGVIGSQKFRAARGGVVPGQPSSVDSVDALLAPGEMVINSNSAQMFPQTLSAINQAGGGISLAPESNLTSVKSEATFQQNKQPQVVEAVMVYSKFDESYKQGNRLRNAASFSNR